MWCVSFVVSDTSEIMEVIDSFFRVGITKNTDTLRDIQLDDPRFGSFHEVPPYDLKDFETSMVLESLMFVGIFDYQFKLVQPKVSIFGDTAVVATGLQQKGVLVDNKIYTGEHISAEGRATFVLVKVQSVWKIVHIHISRTNLDQKAKR